MNSNPLADTTERAIPLGETPHTCTCPFPGGEIAVVNVYGAGNQRQAHALVACLWSPRCRYTVIDGDCTYGHAQPFMLFLSSEITTVREKARRSSHVLTTSHL